MQHLVVEFGVSEESVEEREVEEDSMDTVRALKQVIMFKELPEPVLEIVAGTAEEVSVPAGEEIISVTDTPDALFIIRNGTVRVTHESAKSRRRSSGRERPLATCCSSTADQPEQRGGGRARRSARLPLREGGRGVGQPHRSRPSILSRDRPDPRTPFCAGRRA